MVEALSRAGVRRVVYTSFAAPAPDATFTFARTHYATEQAIERAGLEYTFLRDNFYLDVLPGLRQCRPRPTRRVRHAVQKKFS